MASGTSQETETLLSSGKRCSLQTETLRQEGLWARGGWAALFKVLQSTAAGQLTCNDKPAIIAKLIGWHVLSFDTEAPPAQQSAGSQLQAAHYQLATQIY